MKKILLAIILISACGGCLPIPQQKVVMNDYEHISLGKLPSNGVLQDGFSGFIRALFSFHQFFVSGDFYKEIDPTHTKYHIGINITSLSSNDRDIQRLVEGREVVFFVDGKTHTFLIEEVTREIIGSKLLERCTVGPLPEQMLTAIRNRREIKFKICTRFLLANIEGTMDEPALDKMNTLLCSTS